MSHFSLTPKSLGAAIVAVLGILAAYDYISPQAAAAIGAAVAPILALLVPSRECTNTASAVTVNDADPIAPANAEGKA